MKPEPLHIVVCGLSITSSWGNGHATTYRALLRKLAARGHRITFLERDVPWYRENRDYPKSDYCDIQLYPDLEQLRRLHTALVRKADAVIIGSYVPEGKAVIRWILDEAPRVVAFYDIDTPVTVADLNAGRCEYLTPDLIPEFDLYLSFTGGPILDDLEYRFGARQAHLLACSVDDRMYYPEPDEPISWELGYLGTYSADRQPKVDTLLLEPALRLTDRRFAIAGSLYPKDSIWPVNVERVDHLPPADHRRFYNAQRFTLNVTRENMVRAGYSPSVRLFEAAACGTPIISDWWPGIEIFFEPDEEVLIAQSADDCCRILVECDESQRARISRQARARVLSKHTAAHRAEHLERLILSARRSSAAPAISVREEQPV